jgi:hypothetical protein
MNNNFVKHLINLAFAKCHRANEILAKRYGILVTFL